MPSAFSTILCLEDEVNREAYRTSLTAGMSRRSSFQSDKLQSVLMKRPLVMRLVDSDWPRRVSTGIAFDAGCGQRAVDAIWLRAGRVPAAPLYALLEGRYESVKAAWEERFESRFGF